MADENKVFDVEIITPDRVFFTGTATMIEFNTAAGELGVYARHIPLTTVSCAGGCNDPQAGRGGYHCCGSFRVCRDPAGKGNTLQRLLSGRTRSTRRERRRQKARAEERLANRTEAIDVKRAEFALRKALVRIDIAR